MAFDPMKGATFPIDHGIRPRAVDQNRMKIIRTLHGKHAEDCRF